MPSFSKQFPSFTNPSQFPSLFEKSEPPSFLKRGSNYDNFIKIFKLNEQEKTFAVTEIYFIHEFVIKDGNTKNEKSLLVTGKHLKL